MDTTGLDAQTARMNSGDRPPEVEADPVEAYREWQTRTQAKLGVSDFRADIAADNKMLVAALALIAAAGAPAPVVIREVIAYPMDPAKSFESDVYVFTHPMNPRVQHRSTEYLLAISPGVVIEELRSGGFLRS